MEVTALVQERNVHVAEQVAAHAAILVACQGGTQRETIDVVNLARHELDTLYLLGIFQRVGLVQRSNEHLLGAVLKGERL